MIKNNHNVCFKTLNKNSTLKINNFINNKNLNIDNNRVNLLKNDLDHSKYTQDSNSSTKENKNVFKDIKLYDCIQKLIHFEIKNCEKYELTLKSNLEKLKLDYLDILVNYEGNFSKYEIKLLKESINSENLEKVEGNKDIILKKFDLNEDDLESCFY